MDAVAVCIGIFNNDIIVGIPPHQVMSGRRRQRFEAAGQASDLRSELAWSRVGRQDADRNARLSTWQTEARRRVPAPIDSASSGSSGFWPDRPALVWALPSASGSAGEVETRRKRYRPPRCRQNRPPPFGDGDRLRSSGGTWDGFSRRARGTRRSLSPTPKTTMAPEAP